VPQATISAIESGRVTRTSHENIANLAGALGVTKRLLYQAADLIEPDDLPIPDAAEGEGPDDPLGDVLAWLREDAEIVADFADAKATMPSSVYRSYVRATANALAAVVRAQRDTWRLARDA
jgi:transcriptional regulator with XRE-family HTH domain